ncbi:DUF3006 domain-containing protein [Lysinibacillus sp. FSL M8-0216]|uniref:DUF3006 domain-containing protein n=1 Tax=Lysinibacillus fusiformis TaxID=28031 RepID=A0A1H9Q0C0_9BACI|nr:MULTISPECIES: DUF3006 domain-containing protein [Lysinibacillus]HAU35973.1 DUF3006 domain-containing protein [Lysinibacillus sp.]MCG7437388.1 DUF3006 domain-containing protein [Lysinibacillus fusiformis]MED4078980.1 DUF3006 domain-containing protein [Lysinibacillus fusiformis]MED4672051.1 DUF3006 domain-containing protein [Lysinibacillus fusiformis]NOG29961.1 DUF3006 domain-containing protein [Lysinibacillus fusiformis]
MSSTKYTLDRMEDGYAVFLKYPEEEEQIIILQSAMNKPVVVGDRVQIEEIDGIYHIDILREETEQKKADIQNLMDRLRHKHQ